MKKKKKNIITMGIDQSFKKTAIVIMKNGEMQDFFTVSSEKSKDWIDRAWEITLQVIDIFLREQPQKVAIEGLAFGAKGDQTRNLGGLQFCIVTQLKYIHNADIQVIAPNSLKKFATGHGRCGKEAVIEALPEHICQQFKDAKYRKTTGLHDLADSYFLAKRCYEEIINDNKL